MFFFIKRRKRSPWFSPQNTFLQKIAFDVYMPTLETLLSSMAFKACFRQRQTSCTNCLSPDGGAPSPTPLRWHQVGKGEARRGGSQGRFASAPSRQPGKMWSRVALCSCQPGRPVSAQGPVLPWGKKSMQTGHKGTGDSHVLLH